MGSMLAAGNARMVVAALALAALAASAATPEYEPPTSDSAASTRALARVPREARERVSVTIYEFRSSVSEIAARGSTDMFRTALVRSGQFRVVERARLNEGVVREKQLNASGLADGNAAEAQLSGAQYIFEGTISGANPSQDQRSSTLSIAGMELGGGKNRDVIVIDVSVVDVATGEVLDVITVKKSVLSSTSSVGGIGNAVGALLAQRGGRNGGNASNAAAFIPDLKLQNQHKESLDDALRAAIELAVTELAGRFRQ
jgi:curli biogenesis system outer membrane secretion channel CsgG